MRNFRTGLGLAVVVGGAAILYWLMVLDAHFGLMVCVGAVVGAISGFAFASWRGIEVGAILGAIVPPAYLVLWFAFDLPPYEDFEL